MTEILTYHALNFHINRHKRVKNHIRGTITPSQVVQTHTCTHTNRYATPLPLQLNPSPLPLLPTPHLPSSTTLIFPVLSSHSPLFSPPLSLLSSLLRLLSVHVKQHMNKAWRCIAASLCVFSSARARAHDQLCTSAHSHPSRMR